MFNKRLECNDHDNKYIYKAFIDFSSRLFLQFTNNCCTASVSVLLIHSVDSNLQCTLLGEGSGFGRNIARIKVVLHHTIGETFVGSGCFLIGFLGGRDEARARGLPHVINPNDILVIGIYL